MKKNNLISSLIIVTILLIISVAQYSFYPTIHDTATKKSNYFAMNEYVAKRTQYYDYVIDLNMKQKANKNTDINQYLQFNANYQEFINDKRENFSYLVEKYYRDLLKNEKDIYYQAIDTQTKQTESNTTDDLSNLLSDKKLQDKYQWYYQIQYDQKGNCSINFTSSDDEYSIIEDSILNYQLDVEDDEYYDEDSDEAEIQEVKYQPPKNLTITYAVPKNLDKDSTLLSYILMSPNNDYILYSLPYICGFILLTMLITFFTPIRYLKENKFLHFVSEIKFGILATIWGFMSFFMTYFSTPLIVGTVLDYFTKILEKFGIEKIALIFTPTINVCYWFIYYGLFMILAYMIKYLFHKGLKQYMTENTIIAWILKNCQRLINQIINFDLENNVNKSVLKIVLFNFVIMAIICIFFGFGIPLAFIYSIIIFIFIKNKFENIQDDYQVLLNATKELSNGHFDVQINEDVGIFNPLKDEFSHIKEGFQKAVNEEVKSQKMKTELISNVSHDLKTPLTSIITYVDLLKNNDLNKEEQQQYLEILERNSLRLKNLIDDLFEVSKANSGDVKLDFVDVDIVSLIKQAQLECQDKLDEKHLDMRFHTFDEKIICYLDSSKTYRIFENLFMNMSKYAMAYTRVYIDITEVDHDIQIVFKNISEAEMAFNENEIVERFVQGDKSRNTSGSGLGLAIVKSFTELQHGEFKVELDGDLFKTIIRFKK